MGQQHFKNTAHLIGNNFLDTLLKSIRIIISNAKITLVNDIGLNTLSPEKYPAIFSLILLYLLQLLDVL